MMGEAQADRQSICVSDPIFSHIGLIPLSFPPLALLFSHHGFTVLNTDEVLL